MMVDVFKCASPRTSFKVKTLSASVGVQFNYTLNWSHLPHGQFVSTQRTFVIFFETLCQTLSVEFVLAGIDDGIAHDAIAENALALFEIDIVDHHITWEARQ